MDLLSELLDAVRHNPWVGVFILVGLGMITSMVTKLHRNQTRERTRREIAAYVAEGSMTPEQGERILRANDDPDGKGAGTHIA